MTPTTKATHTPGPWNTQQNADYTWNVWVEGSNGGTQSITRNVMRESNARLIAAAPELLEQLKKAVECLHGLNEFDKNPMLQAIAKAEGR